MDSKTSKTIGDSIEETKEFHTRFLRAVNNPVRRRILIALKDSEATFEDLQVRTGLDPKNLEWQLSILEWGFCVEKVFRDGTNIYKLTQEGKVIDFMNEK
ncbi:winged helix-turn-helix transcriptional regulator [Candidatus Bathyarchaeota archaeon]|nr:winged helix-turn-helix transcriptional regulator [Candidatus Bathyarchaeota archaeon]MBS7631404.1 winged helix-turn-helix transcriptional regulator [Candidatus Bathyarchaeota archaeon]